MNQPQITWADLEHVVISLKSQCPPGSPLQEVVTGFSSKKKAKSQQKNAQQLLVTNSGCIHTGDVMISALLADEEARAAKETSKEAAKALRDLRAAHNAWRAQANAEKAAKHAQNLAEWQLRGEALPPGTQKPRKPVQLKCKDTPA